MNDIKGRFEIHEPFKMSGRGIVFTGIILESSVNVGDFLKFEFDGQQIERVISGIDNGKRVQEGKPAVGILIKCENDEEIDELKAWSPNLATAVILDEEKRTK